MRYFIDLFKAEQRDRVAESAVLIQETACLMACWFHSTGSKNSAKVISEHFEKPSTEVLCLWTTAAVSHALSFEHKPFKLVVKFLTLTEL